MLSDAIEFDASQDQLRFALAIKFSHARDRLCDVLDGALDGDKIISRPLAEVGLPLQERFGVKRDGRDGVVDIVGEAAGHLAQRPQPLLLHDALLTLAQIVIGLLQRSVQPGLVRG